LYYFAVFLQLFFLYIQKKLKMKKKKNFYSLILFAFLFLPFFSHANLHQKNTRIVFISELEKNFAFSHQEAKDSIKLQLSKPGWLLIFEENSRKLLINGTLTWMNYPAVKLAGVWAISRIDVDKLIIPIITGKHNYPLVAQPRIIIDAGHGGKDNGAASFPLIEKKATLEIARRVHHKLTANNISSFLTRDKDVYLDLTQRTILIKRRNANFFISIHLNSSSNPAASGIETYIMSPAGCTSTSGQTADMTTYQGNQFDSANARFAYLLHREVIRSTKAEDRGIKWARFHVLKMAATPAVLIECGFVSSPTDKQKLLSEAYLNLIAEGIANGLNKIFNEMKINEQK